ncbi:Arrestin or S-antigen domain-containing [Pyrenophora seminiperda CCB06]|uniref:Arrestin or S-antigen domain-containing n=1 Tax=Pyrenophora seminiperda CCB06 TaxID=1302712 RepID=A0A3M7M3R0_9PLEO|nr:Arrestin or S-antigen domain-containing [Pyrenophora seminiperda CCB06]
MTIPVLRVDVDGDSNKVYQRGDQVTGRITLILEKQEDIESLNLVFAGSCLTRTSRPLYVNGNTDAASPRRDFEEKIRLFRREKDLATRCTLLPKKYLWTFEFVFPENTEPQYKGTGHGSNYLREPHPLPPSFQVKTNFPGGTAHISYFIQAKLVLSGFKDTRRCKHILRHLSTPPMDLRHQAKVTPSVLYGQTWKPTREKEKSRVKKVLSGVSMNSTPRITPTLFHPQQVAPGQHIPLSLSLLNARDPANHAGRLCTIDSLKVTISTYSTTRCGRNLSDPEDVVSKHVTCISRTSMHKSIPFNCRTTLTSDFRLIDNTECVPTFKTYSITRRYELGIAIGIKYNEQSFTIRSSTPLDILPRMSSDVLPPLPLEREDVEPLPQYTPREPSREFAPDYEEICALSWTSSSSTSLSPVASRDSSLFSAASAPATAASSPVREIEALVYERAVG